MDIIIATEKIRWIRRYAVECYPLQDARQVLGGGTFRKALFDWTIEELEAKANQIESRFTDAFYAYCAVLRFRRGRELNNLLTAA